MAEKDYICHGYLGGQILQKEGLPKHALICERHVGVGITRQDILQHQLDLPARDMIPQTIEEIVICFADLFYSKDALKLEKEKSITKIVKRQAKILDALWQVLNSGGMLLYVTCSIFKMENEQQVIAFLERHDDAQLDAMKVTWGRGKIGRQLLPGEEDMDGFYFARIKKQ